MNAHSITNTIKHKTQLAPLQYAYDTDPSTVHNELIQLIQSRKSDFYMALSGMVRSSPKMRSETYGRMYSGVQINWDKLYW